MTGRELILYILSNGLEDEPVFKDGTFLGFLTIRKAAEKMNVGMQTVHTWISLGRIKGAIKLDNEWLIPEIALNDIMRERSMYVAE